MRNLGRVFGILVCGLLGSTLVLGQSVDPCQCVRSYVDPAVSFPSDRCKSPLREPTDSEFIAAAACLLKEKGNRNKSRFLSAVLSTRMSENLPAPSVEIAALYEINRIFEGNDENLGWAIVLEHVGTLDSNSPEVVRIAFSEFELWFSIVRRIGVAEAIRLGFSPLKHSEVRWFRRD